MAKNQKVEASPEVIEEVATEVVAPQVTHEVAEVAVAPIKGVTVVGKMKIEDF